ncbi:lysoplasmalogenase [Robertkochia marina]|uniref:Lysoplasmalogenase n=1 Tax=Robertkochia marina TaxID=1227945 RepID=A0A4V6RRT5_9FLAO|nr:lysoplasmalogenase [Robertkochia marina]THD68016.1 lysoplasmalogenase [Robertkochia marina]TRZ42699.1 lysoplasmalogenase [Robertkochia marina]
MKRTVTNNSKGSPDKDRISKSLFPFIYGLIVLFDLIVLSIPEWMEIREISKPLIVGSLMVWLVYKRFPLPGKRDRIFFLALFFSFLGDGFLNYEGYFLPGLLSFFIAHICYCVIFLKWNGISTALHYKRSAPLLLYAVGVFLFIQNDLGPLKAYVILYMIILLLMVISVLSRKGLTTKTAFTLGVSGALLFLFSDSLLAINKFTYAIPYASQMIMFSYALAQFFLIRSFFEEDAVQA